MVKYTNEIEAILLDGLKEEWYSFIEQQQMNSYYDELIKQLSIDYQNEIVYPKLEWMLRPMKALAPASIKVVIIGQDPYHNGMADGLAFSSSDLKVPASLRNIFKEITSDVGVVNTSPNLAAWQNQGVFLINSCLSVIAGNAKSHAKIGWSDFVLNLVTYLDSLDQYIFVLWGKDAQKFEKYLNNAYVIKGVHPSPLAGKGFFNQKYFSRINEILTKQNKEIIDWSTDNEI